MMDAKQQALKSQKLMRSSEVQVLEEHKDEVLFVKFSHNGKYLVSASKDKSAIIWEVNDRKISMKHRLKKHKKPVTSASWSPDDEELLTCGWQEVLRCWNVKSGKCNRIYPGTGVVSCGWFPDGEHIFFGMRNRSISLRDLVGNELQCWELAITAYVSEIAVNNNGMQMFTLDSEHSTLLLDNDTKVKRDLFVESKTITSFSLSKDNKFLLVNLIDGEIHLWNIEEQPQMVSTFKGHKCSGLVIRSCFGGDQEKFVASGSEDSKVYIWLKDTGRRVTTLQGHSGIVNCVSWNPTDHRMLASASDDRTIRIWYFPKL